MDTLTKAERSARMSLIQGKNTKPERMVRHIISSLGYRYRLNSRKLPGSPDLVFAGRLKVIFVHGCFWHLHSKCKNNRPPKSRIDFWEPKLAANKKRDQTNLLKLHKLGWKTLVVWECELRQPDKIARRIVTFLESKT